MAVLSLFSRWGQKAQRPRGAVTGHPILFRLHIPFLWRTLGSIRKDLFLRSLSWDPFKLIVTHGLLRGLKLQTAHTRSVIGKKSFWPKEDGSLLLSCSPALFSPFSCNCHNKGLNLRRVLNFVKGKNFSFKWNYYASFYCILWMEQPDSFPL